MTALNAYRKDTKEKVIIVAFLGADIGMVRCVYGTESNELKDCFLNELMLGPPPTELPHEDQLELPLE